MVHALADKLMDEMTADKIKKLLQLETLPHEGGFFNETYRSALDIPREVVGGAYSGARSASTAIYYLLTETCISRMHRLPGDELFHFYLGDPVRMLQIHPDGSHEEIVLGQDLAAGMRPQVVVPGGTWQGARVIDGGRFALLGATMAPGFDFDDYEHGQRSALAAAYPALADRIRALTDPD